MIKYPLNNDKITPSNHAVHPRAAMVVKDADGTPILIVQRSYFGTGEESRRRAVAFARHIVWLLNGEFAAQQDAVDAMGYAVMAAKWKHGRGDLCHED